MTNTLVGDRSDQLTWFPSWRGPGSQYWYFGSATNYLAFVGFQPSDPKLRLALGLRDEQGQVVWASQRGDAREGVTAFVFDLSAGTYRVAMEAVLRRPAQTEFVVKPPLVD